MNHSTPGLPVHHQLLEFTQTHVHWVGDAIQPSHPLSSPSPPAYNASQHHSLFQWVNSSHEVAKVLEFQLQHQSFQRTPRTDLLQNGLVGSPCSPRNSQESSPTPQFKSISSSESKKIVSHCFHCFPIYLPWNDGTGCHDLSFWKLIFKPTFLLSSFTFIKRLFSFSLLSAVRVMLSAFLRLLILLLAILFPACASSSLTFHIGVLCM